MRNTLIPLACLALSGCAVAIPDFRPMGTASPAPVVAPVAPVAPAAPMSAKERFVSAAEANGCVLNSGNISTVMTEAELTSGDLQTILPSLVDEGRASPAGGSAFAITTPACGTA